MSYPAAPEIDPVEINYAHCQVTEYLPIKADDFFDWYLSQPMENFMPGSLIVPAIATTDNVGAHSYGSVGSTRRIKFKNGKTAYERVFYTNFPRSYSYQPYAYMIPISLFSDYAKATMTVLPEGDGCKVVWDYAFHARNSLSLNFVRLFVKLEWTRYLSSALELMRNRLEQQTASAQGHGAGRVA
ncbi:MAG: SRPBCC family protein [Mesorhizobium sp.]